MKHRYFALVSVAVGVLLNGGDLSAYAQAGGNPIFGGRDPRQCPVITHPPSTAEATALVQCSTEGPFGTIEVLLTNVKVQVLAARSFDIHQDQWAPSIDTRTQMYLIKVNAQYYACSRKIDAAPGQNCIIEQYHDNSGFCWRTTSGVYRCGVQGSAVGFVVNKPPPTNY
jgi:hypothetical protein